MKRLVNITVEIEEEDILGFEYQLRDWLKVISLQILPDTKNMYDNDPNFKQLVRIEKSAKKTKAVYINDNNHKYLCNQDLKK